MAHFNELPPGGAGVVPKLGSSFENSYNVTLLPPFIFSPLGRRIPSPVQNFEEMCEMTDLF